MKLYYMQMRVHASGDLVSFKGDRSGRMRNYFIEPDGNGKFLQYTTPRAEAQEYMTHAIVAENDFLDADLSIPIFSIRAAEVIACAFPNEVEMCPLKIDVRGVQIDFTLCRVKNYTSLVDKKNSLYLKLTDSSPILSRPSYLGRVDRSFNIARDLDYFSLYVVSREFVDVCVHHRLKIDFQELPQSDLYA
jgi:hypothetical protein